jgi:phospholipase C
VRSNSSLWNSTAILITTDEGGGYYDSGYVQPVDFFGDGTRIPFIVVSPYAKSGYVDHTYYDHVSILKFIERNWRLPERREERSASGSLLRSTVRNAGRSPGGLDRG